MSRTRYTDEDKARLLGEFDAGGGSAAAFCRERGISYWTKNYRTRLEEDAQDALSRTYEYYDPIYLLSEAGQAWWRAQSSTPTQVVAQAG